jgi:thiol-disulfide isomerase/thioredoxin
MSHHYKSVKVRGLLTIIAAIGIMMFFSTFALGKTIPAGDLDDPAFPTYGDGKINVRIYTDYYCGPCQAVEPELEPLIEKLVKKGVIRVTFIDTPIHRQAVLQMKYFHYALRKKNSFANAMLVRRTLFETAKKGIADEEKLAAYLKLKNIAFTVYDIKPTFFKLNEYLKYENIKSTPSCVIEKNGERETIKGGAEIVNALKALK